MRVRKQANSCHGTKVKYSEMQRAEFLINVLHSALFIKSGKGTKVSAWYLLTLFQRNIRMKSIVLACLIILSSIQVFAQPGRKFTVEDKKAIKYYLEAEQAYELGLKQEAQMSLDNAIDRSPKFGECYVLLAQIEQDKGNTEAALAALGKTLEISARQFYTMAYFMADIEQRHEDYASARTHFAEFLKHAKDDHPNKPRAQLGIQSCDFAEYALKNPVPFSPENMGEGVNTSDPEYFPCLTADGQTLLFTRLLKDSRAFTGKQEDFFVSVQTDQQWDQAMPLKGINTERNEGAPALSADGQLLIFTACESVDGWGKYEGKGSCDLFFSQRSGKDWVPAQNMGKINSYKWESQPSFSADGRTLYFVRGVRGPQGVNSQDIFFAQLQKDGSWSTPTKIPGLVNTPMEEESVMIHPDGETLYFASNGHPGMGGMDLFVSRKQKDGSWGTPGNLRYPINTGGDENSILVTSEGNVALFASDRPGGFGDLDLYSFVLPEAAIAQKVTYVKGTVLDASSFKYLEAKFELIDLATGELVVESYSNAVDGSFLVCLPPNREYVLNVTKPGYLFYSDSFKLKTKGNNQPYELEVLLQKIKDGSSIVLKNVFFDTDKFDLRAESKIELNKVVDFMNLNPSTIIEIGGHTDDVGSDQTNLVLSENRAKSVVAYLVAQGIAQNRLSAKGYGEGVPKASNDSEIGRAQNRRTEFKVLKK